MLRIVLATVLMAVSTAFPNGARIPMDNQMDAMCTTGNQRPRHTGPNGNVILPSDSPAPFTLTAVGPSPYGPGSVFTVTLKAKPGKAFKGFFITADAEDARFGVKGAFSTDGPNANRAKITQYCSPGMTHTENSPKREITIRYRAPDNFTHGTIQFKATVVESHAVFYTGVLSGSIPSIRTGGVKTETQFTMGQLQGGMGAGGMGGLLAGFDLTAMMKNVMGGMNMGGGPMMNPQGGLPLTRGPMQG